MKAMYFREESCPASKRRGAGRVADDRMRHCEVQHGTGKVIGCRTSTQLRATEDVARNRVQQIDTVQSRSSYSQPAQRRQQHAVRRISSHEGRESGDSCLRVPGIEEHLSHVSESLQFHRALSDAASIGLPAVMNRRSTVTSDRFRDHECLVRLRCEPHQPDLVGECRGLLSQCPASWVIATHSCNDRLAAPGSHPQFIGVFLASGDADAAIPLARDVKIATLPRQAGSYGIDAYAFKGRDRMIGSDKCGENGVCHLDGTSIFDAIAIATQSSFERVVVPWR